MNLSPVSHNGNVCVDRSRNNRWDCTWLHRGCSWGEDATVGQSSVGGAGPELMSYTQDWLRFIHCMPASTAKWRYYDWRERGMKASLNGKGVRWVERKHVAETNSCINSHISIISSSCPSCSQSHSHRLWCCPLLISLPLFSPSHQPLLLPLLLTFIHSCPFSLPSTSHSGALSLLALIDLFLSSSVRLVSGFLHDMHAVFLLVVLSILPHQIAATLVSAQTMVIQFCLFKDAG